MGAYSYQSTDDQYINHSLSFDGVDDYIEIPHNENQVGMSELSVMTGSDLIHIQIGVAETVGMLF